MSHPCKLLSLQYRMHPFISQLVSNCFYSAQVQNAPELDSLLGGPSFYDAPYKVEPLQTLHVRGMEEFINNSYVNVREAECVVRVLYTFSKLISEGGKD